MSPRRAPLALMVLAFSTAGAAPPQRAADIPPAGFERPVRSDGNPAHADPADAAHADPADAGYADLVDQIQAAPVIVDASIRSTARIRGVEAATVPEGHARFYVTADVGALIRGTGGLPARIGYVVDLAPDADGRLPKLKDLRVLLFARRVPDSADQLQLVGRDGQRDWTPARDARVRGIVQALVAPDAPPTITGIGHAFHVPGALPGEGETQAFLTTADGRPVSLSVLRRPGERPRWSVALSEIVDEAAAPPARDTLLWYRLACALPAALPERSTASLSQTDADAAREDYRFVIDALGPCGRSGPAG